MRILVSLAQIPFALWILVAAGLAYMDYSTWNDTVYQPLLASNEAKKGELQRLVAANTRAQEFDAQRAAKLKELQDLGEQFRETTSKIPRTASIPAVLKTFADISDSIGLDIESYKPQAESSDAFVQITPVEVNLNGTYPQLMSFLDAVANMERIVHSKHVTLGSPQKRGGASRLKSKVLFETYSISQASIDQESQGTAAPAAPAQGGK
jgi:type IV pilus assembly protein PilO